jgi:6-phosphogluconolactonase
MSERVIDYGERGKVRVVADGNAIARAGAELVRDEMIEAVRERGVGCIALSGGSTPKAMGAILREEPFRSQVPWGSMQVFWGDERWVPIIDPESNAGEALRGYLTSVPIPQSNIHPFPTSGDPAIAAEIYAETIKRVVPGSPLPIFDLILLGMGQDGHTASLFPGSSAVGVEDKLVVHTTITRLETIRLTFTAPLINAARKVVFLVGGEGKAGPLAEVLDGPRNPAHLPSQSIHPTDGDLIWIVDEAAAGRLALPIR